MKKNFNLGKSMKFKIRLEKTCSSDTVTTPLLFPFSFSELSLRSFETVTNRKNLKANKKCQIIDCHAETPNFFQIFSFFLYFFLFKQLNV